MTKQVCNTNSSYTASFIWILKNLFQQFGRSDITNDRYSLINLFQSNETVFEYITRQIFNFDLCPFVVRLVVLLNHNYLFIVFFFFCECQEIFFIGEQLASIFGKRMCTLLPPLSIILFHVCFVCNEYIRFLADGV